MVVASGCRVRNASFNQNRNDLDDPSLTATADDDGVDDEDSEADDDYDDDGDKMTAKGILICRDNSHSFQERTLNLEQPAKIGRSVARARAAANNAIFDCKVLSRNHALLWYSAGKFYLQDTRSSNGTFVNNQRLSATGLESQAREVCSGDIVQFGVDVMESTKKVTHGCIVATLKLYSPDGKEAKASRSMSVASPAGDVTLEDLYKLNRYVQEANRREEALHGKLAHLQTLVENTRKATDQSWKASIDEDRLLSRVNTVESQLAVACSKNLTDDKMRLELSRLEEEKSQYQIVAKESLRKIHQEKLEVTQKLVQLESRLNETEEECQSLHDVSKHAQMELQELAAKYTEAQRNLEFMEKKLVEKEESSSEIVKWAMQEKKDLLKKVEDQAKIQCYLKYRLRNRLIGNNVDTPKHITALRNYVQTIIDRNPKLLTENSDQVTNKDGGGVNPIEAINCILNKLDSMLAEQNVIEPLIDVGDTNLSNNSENDENVVKCQDLDFNEITSTGSNIIFDERSFDKNELDDDSNNREDSIEHIMDINRRQSRQRNNHQQNQSQHSRRTLVNGATDVDDDAVEEDDVNSETTTDETCSIGSEDAWSTSTSVDEIGEKSVIEMKPVNYEKDVKEEEEEEEDTGKTESVEMTIREVTFASGTNGKDLEEVHYDHSYRPEVEFADVTTATGDDDSSDSIESPNESLASSVAITEGRDDANADIDEDDNVELDEESEEGEHLEGDYVKTLKPLSNCIDRTDSHTREYILRSLIGSLECLRSDDNPEAQQVVKRELDQLRDWFVRESSEIIVDKLNKVYYRTKNENQRIQEVNEELVILKEKYNALNDEKSQLLNRYKTLKAQCGDFLNASYSVPIQYFAPIAVAFVWLLLEKLF